MNEMACRYVGGMPLDPIQSGSVEPSISRKSRKQSVKDGRPTADRTTSYIARPDWRSGRQMEDRRDSLVLALSLVGAGIGVTLAGLIRTSSAPAPPFLSQVVLWMCLGASVIVALVHVRPRGLLRPRAVDVVWGVAIGLSCRLVQGWAESAGSMPFPAAPGDGGLPASTWWLETALGAGFLGPVVEEFFFRAVVLVCVFRIMRRHAGIAVAAATASVVSASGFLLLHVVFSPLGVGEMLQLLLLGALCAFAVLLTGRLWPAVIGHLVYNGSYVLLEFVGSLLSS